MTQEHKPEPWIIRRGDWSTHATLITTAKRRRNKTVPIAEVDTDGFNKEFGDEQKANARRIVACVNACIGVSNGELAMTTMSAVLARMNEAEQQRDELLAALEKLSGDVEALMKESGGVYGLHQNGEPAPWGELVVGGRHETWLLSLTDAVELIAKLKAGAA